MRITSGDEPIGRGDALAAVLRLADHVEVLDQLEEAAQPAPHDGVVVDQQDSDRTGFVRHAVAPVFRLGLVIGRPAGGPRAGSMHQREDALGLGHVTQSLLTEVAQHRALRGPSADQVDGPAGDQRLATGCQCLDPRRSVQGRAVEALEPLLHLAACQRHPDADAPDLSPVLGGDGGLELHRGVDGRPGIGEGGVGPVADALEDATAVALGGGGDELVVSDHRARGGRAVLLGKAGRSLDVGEEECQLAHGGHRGRIGDGGHAGLRIGAGATGFGGRLT